MTARMARLLVPIDFSPLSELALEYATVFADRAGSSAHLLHVVEDPFYAGSLAPELYIGASLSAREMVVHEAAARLARMAAYTRREWLHVTSEVRVGFAPEIICGVAEERQSDLILMGTHGRTGLAHLLVGSVAEHVVRRAPCPVFTVRSHVGTDVPAVAEFFADDFVPTE